jgi:hypothetical protein
MGRRGVVPEGQAMSKKYTHSPRPGDFRDVVALFNDGQTTLYSACEHHAHELIVAEHDRLEAAELPIPVLWQIFRSPAGQKICSVCSQLLRIPASSVIPMSRVPIKGVKAKT